MPKQPEFKKTDIEREDPILAYFDSKGKFLANDYSSTPDGNYVDSCTLIALDMARLLLEAGKRPSIMTVVGERVMNPAFVTHKTLVPVQYQGRVKWGSHVVCVCEGLVYDPMIGKPVSIETYAHQAFGVDVVMETMVSEDRIVDYLKEKF